MTRRYPALSILLLLLAAGSLQAQKGRPAREPQPEHTLLWRISGNGLTRSSYIYGTMHTTDPRAFDLADSVLLKLQECESFAMEIDLDSATRLIFREIFHPDTSAPDIREWLDAEQENDLDSMLQSTIGFSLEQLAHIRPWLLGNLVEKDVEPEDSLRRPFSPRLKRERNRPVFLDAWLARVARGEGKEVVAIESIDEQISLFDTVPYPEQIAFFLNTDDQPAHSSARSLSERMIRHYHDGNLDALMAIDQEISTPDFYLRRLLTDRNHAMATRIASRIRTTTTFVAVGAGHLPGPEGVLQLLRDEGFSVTPVRAVRTGLAQGYREKEYRREWKRFEDRTGAFAVEFPSDPFPMPGADDAAASARATLSVDLERGAMYMVSYDDNPVFMQMPELPFGGENRLPRQTTITGDAYVLHQYLDAMTMFGGTLLSSSDDTIDGMPALSYKVRYHDGDINAGVMVLRGSRLYTLSARGPSSLDSSDAISRFVTSLRLLDIVPPVLHHVVSDSLGIEADLPAPMRLSIDTTFGAVVMRGDVFDTSSGDRYSIEKHGFSRFHRMLDTEADFDRQIARLRHGDSIYRRVELRHGDDPAVEVELGREGRTLVRRIRIVRHGRHFYYVILRMPRASANGDLSDRMLASIRLTDEAEEASAVNRITELVALADRGGDDAFDLLGAAMTIRESGLDGDEIRMLHQTLQQKRADDTARRSSLRMILLTMLAADTGSARLAALRQIYPTFDELPIHRAMLRAVLAESGTAEAISWLCDLLLEEKDTSGAAEEYALSILARDLSTAHLLFPKLAPLMENPDHSYLLLSLLYRALDSNKVLPSSVVAERPRIIGIVTRAMADTGRHALWRAVRGIQVLSSLPRDEQTEELFLRALDSRKIEVSYAAVIALIRTEGDLERLSFTQYAAKPRYRLQLYRELEKKNLVDRFPQRYLTQNAISEGALAEWLESEDVELPKEFINFDSREVTVDGTVYRAYLFKFRYTSKSKDWMVGLGSLQPLDATQIDFTDQHARSLYRRLYTATTEEHLDALLAPPSTESSYRSFEFISPTEEAEATEE